jgi:hypothetical protein
MGFVDELERRAEPRRRGPVLGKLLVGGKTRPTRLRTFSAGIVYAETADALPASASVVVWFSAPDGPCFVLEAVAPRREPASPRSLASVAAHGYPLRILNPPEPYVRWVLAAAEG